MTVAGLVLAGGASKRMGREKAFAPIGDRPMLARVIDRLAPQVGDLAINANGEPGRFARFGLPVLADDRPDTGPLGGLLAGLRWAENLPSRPDFLATAPVDSPFLPDDLVERLTLARGGAPMIAIAASGERDHPVVGLWPVAIADRLADWRQTAKSQGVRGFIAAHGFAVASYPLPALGPDPFLNVNTPAELAEAERWLSTIT